MYNVLQLLVKFGVHLLFVVLEIFCFYLIVNYNRSQKDKFLNSANVYGAEVAMQKEKLSQYLHLKDQNDSLMFENATLIENLIMIEYSSEIIPQGDSILNHHSLIPVSICNSTVHLRNNHITLCKGSREGIRPDMGVVSTKGIVGTVRSVSPNFAHVITLLNSQTKISCSIKNGNGHGTLVWKNMDPMRMTLESVPKHVGVSIGDTIITSGYSTMFPRGILVGKIESYKISTGSNTYDITVKLFNDLTNIKYAYVVQNRFGREQLDLENEIINEQ